MKNAVNEYAILLKFLLKEKRHSHWGEKNIVCLIPDHLHLLDKTRGWAVGWEPGEWVLPGSLKEMVKLNEVTKWNVKRIKGRSAVGLAGVSHAQSPV